LLQWARVFTTRVASPAAFRGPRGEPLRKAHALRRLAERAASADERAVRWFAPLVDAGDDLRRQAQDALFVNDRAGADGIDRLLDLAGVRYRESVEVAARVTDALDLIEEIESELPYYGEWRARGGADRLTEGLGTC
jgi:hypothetical protein